MIDEEKFAVTFTLSNAWTSKKFLFPDQHVILQWVYIKSLIISLKKKKQPMRQTY